MKILQRNEITIIDSNLSDDTPKFNISVSYTKGDIVRDNKSKYKAKSDVANQPLDNNAYWEWIGPSNEWALFDFYLNTAATNPNIIDVTFSCVGAMGIYIYGIKARILDIEVIDAKTSNVLEKQTYRLQGNSIASWSVYFFGGWSGKEKSDVYYERKTYTRFVTFRIRAYGLEHVEIGSIICGKITDIAMTLYAKNSIPMLDFSKIESDELGLTKLTKGNFKRTNSFEVLVEDKDMDRVSYILRELRGEPVVFVIANYFESLINFGFLKNHEILLEKVGKSIISIEIEGLI